MSIELEKKKITNQAELASLVPCHRVTLSKAKHIKLYLSAEKYEVLAKLTGIDKSLWAYGSRRKLASELRAFFRQQKFGY